MKVIPCCKNDIYIHTFKICVMRKRCCSMDNWEDPDLPVHPCIVISYKTNYGSG